MTTGGRSRIRGDAVHPGADVGERAGAAVPRAGGIDRRRRLAAAARPDRHRGLARGDQGRRRRPDRLQRHGAAGPRVDRRGAHRRRHHRCSTCSPTACPTIPRHRSSSTSTAARSIMGGGEACRALATQMAATVRMHTWSLDYRMPPDHPYPAALDDCIDGVPATVGAAPARAHRRRRRIGGRQPRGRVDAARA